MGQWNAGSGRESDEFYEAEERSMSVGDVVEMLRRAGRVAARELSPEVAKCHAEQVAVSG